MTLYPIPSLVHGVAGFHVTEYEVGIKFAPIMRDCIKIRYFLRRDTGGGLLDRLIVQVNQGIPETTEVLVIEKCLPSEVEVQYLSRSSSIAGMLLQKVQARISGYNQTCVGRPKRSC